MDEASGRARQRQENNDEFAVEKITTNEYMNSIIHIDLLHQLCASMTH